MVELPPQLLSDVQVPCAVSPCCSVFAMARLAPPAFHSLATIAPLPSLARRGALLVQFGEILPFQELLLFCFRQAQVESHLRWQSLVYQFADKVKPISIVANVVYGIAGIEARNRIAQVFIIKTLRVFRQLAPR